MIARVDFADRCDGWTCKCSRIRSATASLASAKERRYSSSSLKSSAATPAKSFTLPNDPGSLESVAEVASAPGGWALRQWNFLPWEGAATSQLPVSPGGIDAVGAWQNLVAVGRPGAAGISVAVLDTGVAYRNKGLGFLRSPDFGPGQFSKGFDFVDNDRVPLDKNGHGTHVAGTIAEKTDNGIGLTGLAYRAKLMPIRVLDA